MAKTAKDAYSEILRLRNEFYQKWQEVPQYDENREAYKAKYEAFDKVLELLTPSIVGPQPEDSDKLTHSVTKISDKEEFISDELNNEIDRWITSNISSNIRGIYEAFFRVCARHFAKWQKEIDKLIFYNDLSEFEDIKKLVLNEIASINTIEAIDADFDGWYNRLIVFAKRCAQWQKLQMMKDFPTWKKSKKLIEGALLDRGILYIPRYMIELSELKKLPKEDRI